MGFRIRKVIELLPGIKLNISKSGLSGSIGTRGATVNVSKNGVKGTVGVPGSGFSYSRRVDVDRLSPRVKAVVLITILLALIACLIGVVVS